MTWQLFGDWLYLTGVLVSIAVLLYGAGVALWWHFWEGGADDDTVRADTVVDQSSCASRPDRAEQAAPTIAPRQSLWVR